MSLTKDPEIEEIYRQYEVRSAATSCVQALLIAFYTLYIINTFKEYGDKIQPQFKAMMKVIYVLMFLTLAIDIWGSYQMADDKQVKQFYIWYVLDRAFLIVLYMFLLILKRVQIMVDPKYVSIKMVVASLKKQRIIDAFFLSINAVAVIVYVINFVFSFQDRAFRYTQTFMVYSRIRAIVQLTVFCLNIYTLYYFVSMGRYFMSVSQDNRRKMRQFKLAALLVFSIILVSMARDNLLIFAQITLQALYKDDPKSMYKYYRVTNKAMNYIYCFNALLPFTIASFITFIVRYFASGGAAPNYDSKFKTETETNSQQDQSAAFGKKLRGSINGGDDNTLTLSGYRSISCHDLESRCLSLNGRNSFKGIEDQRQDQRQTVQLDKNKRLQGFGTIIGMDQWNNYQVRSSSVHYRGLSHQKVEVLQDMMKRRQNGYSTTDLSVKRLLELQIVNNE